MPNRKQLPLPDRFPVPSSVVVDYFEINQSALSALKGAGLIKPSRDGSNHYKFYSQEDWRIITLFMRYQDWMRDKDARLLLGTEKGRTGVDTPAEALALLEAAK